MAPIKFDKNFDVLAFNINKFPRTNYVLCRAHRQERQTYEFITSD